MGADALTCVSIVRADAAGRPVQLAAAGVAAACVDAAASERVSRTRVAVEQMVSHRGETWAGPVLMPDGVPSSGLLSFDVIRRGNAPWAKSLHGLTKTGSDPVGVLWATSALSPLDRSIGLITLLIPGAAGDLSDQNRVLLQTGASTLAKLAFHAIHATSRADPAGRIGEVQWLTPREQDVLELLVEGKSVREISDELSRSPHTVHDYVKSLHRKLGASSRGELVARVLGHVRSDSQQPKH